MRRQSANTAISFCRAGHRRTKRCKGIRALDAQKVNRIITHINFVTQDGQICLFIAGKPVIIRNCDGLNFGIRCKRLQNRNEIILRKSSIAVKA